MDKNAEEKPNGPQFPRRGFLQGLAAFAAMPSQAAGMFAQGKNPYPWITDKNVLQWMQELSALLPIEGTEFRLGFLKKYVLGAIEFPKDVKIGDHTLFANPVWHALTEERSRESIDALLKASEAALAREKELQPRRDELIQKIVESTGEQPWLLRLEPRLRQVLSSVSKEKGLSFIPQEQSLERLKEGVDFLANYARAFSSGTMNEFIKKQCSREPHTHLDEEKLTGKNYRPSKQEHKSMEDGLKHLLNLDWVKIKSNTGLPTTYQVYIEADKFIRQHITDIAHSLYSSTDPANKYMRITNTSYSDAIGDNAYPIPNSRFERNRSPGFLTISEPPAELRELIEKAQKAKESNISR